MSFLSRSTGPAIYPCMLAGGPWEFSHPVYMCFIDLKTTNERGPWGVLWEVMQEYRAPGPIQRPGCKQPQKFQQPVRSVRRTEYVAHCTDCKAHRGNVIVCGLHK